ncbi:hypothetical protein COV24_02040 [candidate division WWE3 bacterium CG10_big_fil_rev_8_21_14_0_10_32_10]|uniref:Glycosyltransferase RgtA/B/C/D-like domain-containing protein n=1 Tax=candidate division WWE3 bacterium CG10_big_fil_rev_8_21_14_0_10_32_10 TaxID=1975090 RepID=A0A2H0RAM5_UNCKA|nr:MAG: hypothetical protein COV24_02040 [candidate division WWE3 bacterium CG10_big_fil_rev_8_21_14_0_10_32_10]
MFKKNSLFDNFNKNLFYVTLFIIFLISVFVRLYFLPILATFGHDNSRDLVLIFKLFKYHEIIYRGPVFSVLWGFLSPIYYYILAPVYYILRFHPLAPAFFSTIINIITLLILFFVSFKIFNKKTALISIILYGLSFKVALEGAYGLNPNLLPPFSVLAFYSLVNIFKNNSKNYLILLFFCLAMLVSFHPSGVFVLFPIVILFIIYKPKIKPVIWIRSILVFFIFAIIPYLIEEKKFNFWNIKQILLYLHGDISTESNIGFFNSISNFFYVFTKNLSLVFFGNTHIFFIAFSFFLLLSLLFFILKFYKKHTDSIFILSSYIFLYLLFFAITVKFDNKGFYAWWFHSVIIPIFILYVSYLMTKIKISYCVTLIWFFIFLNINAYIKYQPPLDTYEMSYKATQEIRNDSMGTDLIEIYGSDRRPFRYMLWYFEQDPIIKEKYFSLVKYEDKVPKPTNVYYFDRLDSNERNYMADFTKIQKDYPHLKGPILLKHFNTYDIYVFK